jgi:hypothetical protein
VYFRLSPAMKRRNRAQQEGPLESREIATISITCNTARDRASIGTSKTCQYLLKHPEALNIVPQP